MSEFSIYAAYNTTTSDVVVNSVVIPPDTLEVILLSPAIYENSAGDLLENFTLGKLELYTKEGVLITGQDGFDSIVAATNILSNQNYLAYINSSQIEFTPTSLTNTKSTNLELVLGDFDNAINAKIILGNYLTLDVVEESDETLYVFLTDPSDSWLIKRIVESGSDIFVRYATEKNNPSVTDYGDAWASHLVLTYGLASEALDAP